MNLYIIVEGRRTEKYVYPAWISHIVPNLVQVNSPYDVTRNNYYLFNGNGYPSLLNNHLVTSIEEVNEINKFNYLVIALDTDESTFDERILEVNNFVEDQNIELNNCDLVVIPQNRCIETWFLGNKRIYKRNPQDPILRDYINFYNVYDNDPEEMGIYAQFETHSQFHADYARKFLRERNIRYSKKSPQGVTDKVYLDNLIERVETTGHLSSLQNFLTFVKSLKF